MNRRGFLAGLVATAGLAWAPLRWKGLAWAPLRWKVPTVYVAVFEKQRLLDYYDYFALSGPGKVESFTIGPGLHPPTTVHKIWMGGELIYDKEEPLGG